MSKLYYFIFAVGLFSLASCGPKRHGCGARGICKIEKQVENIDRKTT